MEQNIRERLLRLAEALSYLGKHADANMLTHLSVLCQQEELNFMEDISKRILQYYPKSHQVPNDPTAPPHP